jgi:hypothetical protein
MAPAPITAADDQAPTPRRPGSSNSRGFASSYSGRRRIGASRADRSGRAGPRSGESAGTVIQPSAATAEARMSWSSQICRGAAADVASTVLVLEDPPGQGHHHRAVHQIRVLLGRRVRVADGQPADPVVRRGGQPGGAHIVVGVRQRDDPERGRHHHSPGGGHRDLPFGHPGQQGVERVLGRAVELLDVPEAALAHGLQQRSVDEVVRAVVRAQHPGPGCGGRLACSA